MSMRINLNRATVSAVDPNNNYIGPGTIPFNVPLARFDDHNTTLSSPATSGTNTIAIQAGDYDNFNNGEFLRIQNGGLAESIFVKIIAKPGSPNLTLNRPLDFSYPATTTLVDHAITNMSSAIGTIASPIQYRAFALPGSFLYITGATLSMITDAEGDDTTFGDLAALLNGGLIKIKISDVVRTFAQILSNKDFRLDGNGLLYFDSAGPAPIGDFAIENRWENFRFHRFIILDGDAASGPDWFSADIQDDITTAQDSSQIKSFEVRLQGFILFK